MVDMNEFYSTVSRARMVAAERLSNELRTFAEGNGLTMSVNSDDWVIVHLKFVDKTDPERTYNYPLVTRRVDNWDEEFIKITHEVSMRLLCEEPVAEPVKVCEDSVRTVDICGLTKNEYIALELTKAWASTTGQRYYDEDDIVGRYYAMLEEVERRG